MHELADTKELLVACGRAVIKGVVGRMLKLLETSREVGSQAALCPDLVEIYLVKSHSHSLVTLTKLLLQVLYSSIVGSAS
jgi:hypothetical protein